MAALLLAPRLVSDTQSPRDQAAQNPIDNGPATGQYTCPADEQRPARAVVPPDDQVPAGAVLARICPISGKGLQAWSAPVDALTVHVDSVVAAYNFLPPGEPMFCLAPTVGQTGFTITFQYPNGHLVSVTAPTNGYSSCDYISIDGRDDLGRARSAVVIRAYFEALQQQRSSHDDMGRVPRQLSCPAHIDRVRPGIFPADPHLDLSAGLLCIYTFNDSGPQFRSRPIPQVLLKRLNADYATQAAKNALRAACSGPPIFPDSGRVIFGKTPWGDTVILASCYGRYTRAPTYTGQHYTWSPSPAIETMLNRLAGSR